ncbi:MAG: hypothetical protein JRI87_09075 [Deltaproteobacteria bacterium]|nr:hypothetical protein [Deltaproteobacteria bacterium]
MKKEEIIRYVVVCFTLLLILTPDFCAGQEGMEILSSIEISATPRHEWNPWVEYNSVDDEFLVIWNVTGILRNDCTPDDDYECTKSFQSVEGTRISPDGEILGNMIISPPEGSLENVSWKAMPRMAHNKFRNEYMVIFQNAPDTCIQCHNRNAETGEPEPANIGRCVECHPGDDPGLCNLATFHDPDKGADCLTCHADCAEGSPPVPPTPHPDSCMGCHKLEDIHYRLGHSSFGSYLYKMRIDSVGNVLSEPDSLYQPPAGAGHPIVAFNSERRQYLIGTADSFFTEQYDNVGFIVDEDTNVLKGPFFFGEGSDGSWTHVLYYVAYNPIDDTYFVPWEDFRHATGAWYFGPNDIYAALLDGDGNTLADIPVIEDFDEGEYEQWYPCVAHNPDRNEFFVTWFDERPWLVEEGGIVGGLFNSDGTPKGEPFVVADAPGSQGDMALVYAKNHKKYFMVWQDTRNYIPAPDDPDWYRENDIYARWLDENGLPAGDAFPIYIGEGDQSMPQMVYSPVSDRFLIAWWDFHAPDDYEPLPGEFGGEYGELSSIPMGVLTAGNVRGAIYGTPGPCAAKEIYGEHSKEVELMRYARDNILKSTSGGQELIKLYYQWSPAIVKVMEEDEEFKKEVKELVDGVLMLIGEEVE